MKKQLILLRHAKAEREFENISDVDRPLTERGVNDAYRMSEYIDSNRMYPDVILTSDAARALCTTAILNRVFQKNIKTEVKTELYLASDMKMLKLLKTFSNEINSILIVGHNPGLQLLIEFLTECNFNKLPTTGLVLLNLDTENWAGLKKGIAKIALFETPNQLKQISTF
jgi:phosphohistidine phosphatase